MRWKLPCLAGAVLGAAFAQTGPSSITREGSCWVQTIRDSVAVGNARLLHVTGLGNITVEGVDSEVIAYSLRRRVRRRSRPEAARLLERVRVVVRRQDGTFHVDLESPPECGAMPALSLTVPRYLAKTWVQTGGGDIEVRGLQRGVVVESGGGRITADQISGTLTARTSGGDIRIGRVQGTIRCISGAGEIQVERAGGESWIETVGGDIRVGVAEAPVHASTGGGNIYVRRAASLVSARTAGGLIEVSEAAGEVIAETASGSIQISSARGVTCTSAGGAIRLYGVSGALRASTAAGNILAEFPDGAELKDSFLDTRRGDITVVIPSNIAMTVTAENFSAGRNGRIISDFPELRIHPGRRSRYEPVRAEGAINGGGPVLRISAAGGTIYLRRRQ